MATGRNIQPGRGREVTNLAPMVNLDTGEDRAWGALGRVADQVRDAAKPGLIRAAQAAGAREGVNQAATGEKPQRGLLSFGQVAEARIEASTRAYLAGMSTDFDGREAQVRTEFAHDVEGYRRKMADVRTSLIQTSDPDHAVEIETYINRRMQIGEADVAERVSRVSTERANRALVERIGSLEAKALGLIADGRSQTIDFQLIQDEILQQYRARAANPALPYSDEEMQNDWRGYLGRASAAGAVHHARSLLQAEGEDAALAWVQTLRDDQDIPVEHRLLATNAAREALNADISLAHQRVSIAEAKRQTELRELGRRIDDDAASIEMTGEASDLTREEVFAIGGNDAMSRWLKRRAEAYDLNALVGELPLDNPEEAAQRLRRRTSRGGSLQSLPTIGDEGDLAGFVRAIEIVESGGRNGLVSRDPDGAGPAGGGAMGVMQLLPDTARRVAQRVGLPFDANRLRTDAAYNRQLGTAYFSELVDRYGGDGFLAVTAYHAGPGNVDGWLQRVGDPRTGAITRDAWLDAVEARGNPRSAAYPRKVLAAMGAGQASAAWDAYTARRSQRTTDPAGSIAGDFAVRTAQQRWQAAPTSTSAGEAYVQASLDAQARGSIPAGQQRSLPIQSLVAIAAEVDGYERADNTDGYQIFAQRMSNIFGKHGQRVMQDVLEVRGDTRFSSMMAARLSQRAAAGLRPTHGEQRAAERAGATEAMNRAANGTSRRSLEAMSDDEILAAAGLGR